MTSPLGLSPGVPVDPGLSFFDPLFLGIDQFGLPIYLHLLKRHQKQEVPFSSLMFFERRTQSSVKQRRLRYLALLALRLLVLLLLVLAFANPYITRREPLTNKVKSSLPDYVPDTMPANAPISPAVPPVGVNLADVTHPRTARKPSGPAEARPRRPRNNPAAPADDTPSGFDPRDYA